MTDVKSKPVETEIISPVRAGNGRGLNVGSLFFGLLLVLIGALATAGNLGWVKVEWVNLSQLWPVIIIIIGLSIISVTRLIWKVVSVVVGLLLLALVTWVMLGNSVPGFNQNIISDKVVVEKVSETVKKIDIDIKTGASAINISSAKQESVATVDLKSNMFRMSKTSTVSGDTQNVILTTEPRNGQFWFFGNIKNTWDVNLNRDLGTSLNVDVGASSLTADLTNTHLTDLDIRTGASSITVRLGSLEKQIVINLQAGASSISFNVPKTSGVRLVLQSGLTGKNIVGLGKVGDDTYETSNYDTATNRIRIDGKLGVSAFSIDRY